MCLRIIAVLCCMLLFVSCNVNEPKEKISNNISIAFDVPEISFVKVDIVNAYNTIIRSYVNREVEAGKYMVTWDGKDSKGEATIEGIYFYEIIINNKLVERKIIVGIKP